jgi:predicted alpha-1,2-mannosidase
MISKYAVISLLVSWAVLLVAKKNMDSVQSLTLRAKLNPEDFVNILGGTDSRNDLSHGSTLPMIAMPWGFNNYAPQTDDENSWWFHPYDRRFFGLRVTHQPSPWISDYGNFLIKAYMPKSIDINSGADNYCGFSPKTTVYSPYFYETKLLPYSSSEENTLFSFAPTAHGGVVRAKFPRFDPNLTLNTASVQVNAGGALSKQAAVSSYKGNQRVFANPLANISTSDSTSSTDSGFISTRRISIVLNGGSDQSAISKYDADGTVMLTGYTTTNSGGVGDAASSAFAHYFVALLYGGTEGNVPLLFDASSGSGFKADSSGVYVDFAPEVAEHEEITVRFATSFISQDQALTNLLAEVSSERSFGSLVEGAKNAWSKVLSRVKITSIGGESVASVAHAESKSQVAEYTPDEARDMLTTFYSAMYRASLFPRSISEYTSDGIEVHWSPYAASSEQRVANGPLSTDSGFWDAWNTVYPLLTLINRPVLSNLMQGWVNAFKEGGWVPQWASPGYRGSMVGTMGDVSMADAIVKEIPGFDVDAAYEGIRKNAYEAPPPGSAGGRDCLEQYIELGYVPRGACSEVVARSLNYLQSDYAIAQAALKLGKTADAEELLARSANYSKIFNIDTAFFRSRVAGVDGKFTEPFDEFGWGGDYTEGGPWQYRFYLPFDPVGLDALYAAAGKDMCEELESVHTQRTAAFHIGGYSSEIHEMTEMTDHCWGQYAHNNQPIHHQLYMSMFRGYQSSCAANAQARIRQVLSELYSPNTDMFPGDEDNGEMASWYILSSLGLYNVNPGSGNYLFGSPQFGSIEVDISDEVSGTEHFTRNGKATTRTSSGSSSKILVVNAINNNKDNVYVQKITWNGEEISTTENGIEYAKLREGGILSFYMGEAPVVTKS